MPYRKALLPSNDISSSRVPTPRAPGAFPGSSRSAVPPSKAGARAGSNAVAAPSAAAAASRPSLPSQAPGRHRLGEGAGWPPRSPEPPRVCQHAGTPTAGGSGRPAGWLSSYRCRVQRRRPQGHLRPLRPPPSPARRAHRPPTLPPLPSRAAAASSPRAMSGCGDGARRQRARAEGGRGAVAAAPRSGRSGDGPAGHVTADVTRPARPSREPAGAVREGRISRERGRRVGGRCEGTVTWGAGDPAELCIAPQHASCHSI